MSYGIYIEELS